MSDILEQAARIVSEHDMPEDLRAALDAYKRIIAAPRTGNGDGATALEWAAAIASGIESRVNILERRTQGAPAEVARAYRSEISSLRELQTWMNCLVDRLKRDAENEH